MTNETGTDKIKAELMQRVRVIAAAYESRVMHEETDPDGTDDELTAALTAHFASDDDHLYRLYWAVSMVMHEDAGEKDTSKRTVCCADWDVIAKTAVVY